MQGLNASFPGKIGNIILEGKSIFYQFELFKKASIVIGQHGAGLGNMFFMNPGTYMIEIMTPWGRRGDHFRNLANSLQINYNKFDLNQDIGPVDANVIIGMISNIYSVRRNDRSSSYTRDDYRRNDDRRSDYRRDERSDYRRSDYRRDERSDYRRSDYRRDDDRRDDDRGYTYKRRNIERWGGKKYKYNKTKKYKKYKKITKSKRKSKSNIKV